MNRFHNIFQLLLENRHMATRIRILVHRNYIVQLIPEIILNTIILIKKKEFTLIREICHSFLLDYIWNDLITVQPLRVQPLLRDARCRRPRPDSNNGIVECIRANSNCYWADSISIRVKPCTKTVGPQRRLTPSESPWRSQRQNFLRSLLCEFYNNLILYAVVSFFFSLANNCIALACP
jgi:hypothetical protein